MEEENERKMNAHGEFFMHVYLMYNVLSMYVIGLWNLFV